MLLPIFEYFHIMTLSDFVLLTTVEPRYLELGYFELPAISNSNSFPLVLPLCFQSFTYWFVVIVRSFTIGYLELGYLELPAISNCLWFPLAQIDPGYLDI